MHGEPAQPQGFTHFPYANPNAPKGGRLVLAKRGSFDSLNPLIVKGVSAEGIREYVYESLLARAYDEPFSLYGLIAESVETPDDRSFVEFTLNPEAKFSDGKPITVDDVIFSFELLRDHGRPNHRSYYQKVSKVEKTGDRKVKFTFDASGDREMPLIMGLMPVLPRHLIDPDDLREDELRSAHRQRTLPRRRGEAWPEHQPQARSELLGREASRSRAVSSISTRSATTTTATAEVCSRPSRQAPSTRGRRTIRRAGRKATTSRRCVTGASSRRNFRSRFPPACRRSCSTRGVHSSPTSACARR